MPGCHIKHTFSWWGSVFKIERKSSASTLSSRFDHLFIRVYISIVFVFVLLLLCYFLIFQFLFQCSISSCNLFVCFLKVFCILLSSCFSVWKQSDWLLYLVQDWQNVFSISFVTYIKYLQGILFRCLQVYLTFLSCHENLEQYYVSKIFCLFWWH